MVSVTIAVLLSLADIARARNAQLIISNGIPTDEVGLDNQARQPYSIWHPDIAREETYRELVRQCPAIRYRVGRACAAAGYVELYQELGLLPDVSIAEEARESDTAGGYEIFKTTTAAS